MSFSQTSTLLPSMHLKLTEHGRCCMQINELLTKSFVDLVDNSGLLCFDLIFLVTSYKG